MSRPIVRLYIVVVESSWLGAEHVAGTFQFADTDFPDRERHIVLHGLCFVFAAVSHPANASIVEPGIIWLLGAGLIALVLVRKYGRK